MEHSSPSAGDLGSTSYQLAAKAGSKRPRRGRKALAPGGVSFASAQNSRGTLVTFHMAWRARAIRQDPDLFLERVREALQLIAAEATAQYEAATAQPTAQRPERTPARKDADHDCTGPGRHRPRDAGVGESHAATIEPTRAAMISRLLSTHDCSAGCRCRCWRIG